MNLILFDSNVVVWVFVLTWSVGINFDFPFLVLHIQGYSHNIWSLYSTPADRTTYRGKFSDVIGPVIGNKRSQRFRTAFPLGSSRAGVSVAHVMMSKIGPLPGQSASVYIFKEEFSTKSPISNDSNCWYQCLTAVNARYLTILTYTVHNFLTTANCTVAHSF